MSKASKILQACDQFSRLVVLARQKPIYMYHGTSSKNLPSILSQGLITDPSKKVWEADEYSSFSFPSRMAVGGIYFTKNIMTAISSANNATKDKEKENRIIIIAEIKPGSLYADEDVVPSSVAQVRMPNAAPNENLSCYLWAYLHVDPTNSDLISAQDFYINNCLQRIKENLKLNLAEELHPKLERRLKDLFEDGFAIALKRQVSHIDDYSYRRGIGTVLERGQIIEKPNKDEAEREYSEYLDRITKVLRKLAISEVSREFGLRSGRVGKDIGYSGGNRIVGILKLSPVRSLDYSVEVIYEAPGGIPKEAFNDFMGQYSEQMTSDFELIRPEKKSYFLNSEIIKKAEEQLSLFSDKDLDHTFKYGDPGYWDHANDDSIRYDFDEWVNGYITITYSDLFKFFDKLGMEYKPCGKSLGPAWGLAFDDSGTKYVLTFGDKVSNIESLRTSDKECDSPSEAKDFVDSADEDDLDKYVGESEISKDFWESPGVLYHATASRNKEEILENGLVGSSDSRGLTNRSVGSAVFTSTNPDAIEAYGDLVFEIDAVAMKAHGYTPEVGVEPDIAEGERKQSLAYMIGLDDYSYDFEGGMDTETYIVYGNIPPEYLKIYQE